MEWVRIGVDDFHPKYEGETKNDEPNGIGTFTYPKIGRASCRERV